MAPRKSTRRGKEIVPRDEDQSPRKSDSAEATHSHTTPRVDEIAELRGEIAKLAEFVNNFVTGKGQAQAAIPELAAGAHIMG